MKKFQTRAIGLAAALAILRISVCPAAVNFVIEFDSPTYSLGALNGQDGWTADPIAAQVIDTNPSPMGGNSIQGGWASWRPMDEVNSGRLYNSFYIYYNGVESNENKAASLTIGDSTTGRRAYQAGRLGGQANLGIHSASGMTFSTFSTPGWYYYQIENNVSAQQIVSATLTEVGTGSSEVLVTNDGWANSWGGGSPSVLNQIGAFIDVYQSEQIDSIAVRMGYDLQPGVRQLFLDDALIQQMDGLNRVVNQPTKFTENPIVWHDETPWQQYRAQVYGTAIYDPDEKQVKMWYLASPRLSSDDPVNIDGRLRVPNFQLVGYAESSDGLHFNLPDLGLVNYDGSTQNNLCRIARECVEGIGVLYDPNDPDPTRRYKALYWEHLVSLGSPGEVGVNGMSVSFSADGKNWTDYSGNPVMNSSSDTGQQVLWDPTINKYVAYGRFGGVGRRIARSESSDFIHWSTPEVVLQADAQDGPGNPQIYGMGVGLYEGVYIGIPWIYHEGTTYKIDTQLATSRDGINWERVGDRETFIPNGPEGSWDAGIIYTASQPPVVIGDTMYIYYSASQHDHNYTNPPAEGTPEWDEYWDSIKTSIGVATLRRDGFVSLDAGDQWGTLVTESLIMPEGSLYLNADATGGEVKVSVIDDLGQVLAESQPLSGDQLHAKLDFLEEMPAPGTTVRLMIAARNTKLYSYWFASDVPEPSAFPGDANCDGAVDEEDAAILAANWLMQDTANWNQGDFNHDGAVNDIDATILAANWGYDVTSQGSVPEPGIFVLLVGAATMLSLLKYGSSVLLH